jgi:hypothetical protein
VADVNAQGQLYPVGMPAERALKLAMGSVVGQSLSVEQLRDRVRARFPHAEPLPERPRLTTLLERLNVPVRWDGSTQQYVPPAGSLSFSSTRMATSTAAPLAGPSALADTDAKLAAVLDRRGYLAVLTSLRTLTAARRALVGRLGLIEVDVTALLVERLRTAEFSWETIVAADTGKPSDPDFRALAEIVQHDVVPALEERLTTDRPMLLTEAAPLARYGQMQVLQHLADPSRPRPGARLLLTAARRLEPPMLDAEQIPLTSPVSQSLWLPDIWIDNARERTA